MPFIFLLLFSPFVLAENVDCLSLPIGITEISTVGEERIVSVAKAYMGSIDDIDVHQTALSEAELLAKSYLSKNKTVTLNGIYMLGSCTESGYVYVAIAIDKKSQAVSKNIKSLLSESFKNAPTLK